MNSFMVVMATPELRGVALCLLCFERLESVDQLFLQLGRERLLFIDLVDQLLVLVLHIAEKPFGKRLDLAQGNVLHLLFARGKQEDHLLVHFQRLTERLLQQLHQPVAEVEQILCRLVELGAELGENAHLTVLREIHSQRAGDLLHRLCLSGAADTRYRQSDVDRGAHTGVEELCLKEDLTVGDRDDVGGDISGYVSRLCFDDRQSRDRTAAVLIVKP